MRDCAKQLRMTQPFKIRVLTSQDIVNFANAPIARCPMRSNALVPLPTVLHLTPRREFVGLGREVVEACNLKGAGFLAVAHQVGKKSPGITAPS